MIDNMKDFNLFEDSGFIEYMNKLIFQQLKTNISNSKPLDNEIQKIMNDYIFRINGVK